MALALSSGQLLAQLKTVPASARPQCQNWQSAEHAVPAQPGPRCWHPIESTEQSPSKYCTQTSSEPHALHGSFSLLHAIPIDINATIASLMLERDAVGVPGCNRAGSVAATSTRRDRSITAGRRR